MTVVLQGKNKHNFLNNLGKTCLAIWTSVCYCLSDCLIVCPLYTLIGHLNVHCIGVNVYEFLSSILYHRIISWILARSFIQEGQITDF